MAFRARGWVRNNYSLWRFAFRILHRSPLRLFPPKLEEFKGSNRFGFICAYRELQLEFQPLAYMPIPP
jgi:hypothetical protein